MLVYLRKIKSRVAACQMALVLFKEFQGTTIAFCQAFPQDSHELARGMCRPSSWPGKLLTPRIYLAAGQWRKERAPICRDDRRPANPSAPAGLQSLGLAHPAAARRAAPAPSWHGTALQLRRRFLYPSAWGWLASAPA